MPDDQTRRELDLIAVDVVRRDPDALGQLYELTADMLASVAFGIVRDRAAAEDIVQDVFLKFVRVAGSIRNPDGPTLRAWLVRAVRNRCIDHIRSARVRREDTSAPLPEAPTRDDAGARTTVDDPDLLEALQQLTEDQRQAVVLFRVAGLSGHEIAQTMNRNRPAVYRLLRRGEHRLREALAGDNLAPLHRPHDEEGRHAT